MSTFSRFTLLGIDDEVTDCELCGKADLKCTMALSELDADGNEIGIVRYGRDCGAAALGWKVSADRAERLAKGTARIGWDVLHRAWSAMIAPLTSHMDMSPARLDVNGATIEVWSTNYGKLPAGKWSKGDTRLHWRVAA